MWHWHLQIEMFQKLYTAKSLSSLTKTMESLTSTVESVWGQESVFPAAFCPSRHGTCPIVVSASSGRQTSTACGRRSWSSRAEGDCRRTLARCNSTATCCITVANTIVENVYHNNITVTTHKCRQSLDNSYLRSKCGTFMNGKLKLYATPSPPFSRQDNISITDCMPLPNLLETIKVNGGVECTLCMTKSRSITATTLPWHIVASLTWAINKNPLMQWHPSVDLIYNRWCWKSAQKCITFLLIIVFCGGGGGYCSATYICSKLSMSWC